MSNPQPVGSVINDAPGKCVKCNGTGRYKWEEGGQQRAGRCFSCNGTGRQSKSQMLRNETYNRWRDKVTTTGMDNLLSMRNKCVKELTKTQSAEYCNAFRVGWDLALQAARDSAMLKGVKPVLVPEPKKGKRNP